MQDWRRPVLFTCYKKADVLHSTQSCSSRSHEVWGLLTHEADSPLPSTDMNQGWEELEPVGTFLQVKNLHLHVKMQLLLIIWVPEKYSCIEWKAPKEGRRGIYMVRRTLIHHSCPHCWQSGHWSLVRWHRDGRGCPAAENRLVAVRGSPSHLGAHPPLHTVNRVKE